MKLWHLAKRTIGSLTAAPLTDSERREMRALLSMGEAEVFERLTTADQRHALHVLRRFDGFAPHAPQTARRAALLHDIGKVESPLGTMARIVATIVGPHGRAFRRYHSHEVRGIELLVAAGSDALTLATLRGDADVVLVDALRRADEI
jgi:hypothetical protein